MFGTKGRPLLQKDILCLLFTRSGMVMVGILAVASHQPASAPPPRHTCHPLAHNPKVPISRKGELAPDFPQRPPRKALVLNRGKDRRLLNAQQVTQPIPIKTCTSTELLEFEWFFTRPVICDP